VIRRTGGVLEQFSGVLDLLPRRIRVEVHDVVRVDEADKQTPRLTLIRERAADATQP